jgi:putative PIN family toxin of toxin-antitoxin system
MPIHVVLDTCVLVSGLRSRRGASFILLEEFAAGTFETGTSVALALEYESVLHRPEFRIPLTSLEIDAFLDSYFHATRLVEIHYLCRPCLADPKDDMVLEAAVNCFSDGIVTHNVGDFQNAARYGIEVWKPADFLKHVRGKKP